MALCKGCQETLDLKVEDDDGHESVVPDDLELPCGCHFHWECLLEQSSTVALSLKCPSCDTYLPSNEAGPSTTNTFLATPSQAPILVNYSSEGGVQNGLDLLPIMTEEAYLQSHPEAVPARAFHLMCSKGDIIGIVDMLRDMSEEGANLTELLRYQNPLGKNESGLHLAVEESQEEVVWLLLWLCSQIPSQSFPPPAREAAESMGVARLDAGAASDVRNLRDRQNLTAGDYAMRHPEKWQILLETQILEAP